MRNKIWYEISQFRHSFEFLALLLDQQKNRRKWFKILTLAFSASGVFSWTLWEMFNFSQVACGIIAVIQVLQLLENQIVYSDDVLEKVGELRTKLLEYTNDLEKLFIQYEKAIITESESIDRYYELRQTQFIDIQKLDNQLDIKHPKKLVIKADLITKNYLKNHFNSQN